MGHSPLTSPSSSAAKDILSLIQSATSSSHFLLSKSIESLFDLVCPTLSFFLCFHAPEDWTCTFSKMACDFMYLFQNVLIFFLSGRSVVPYPTRSLPHHHPSSHSYPYPASGRNILLKALALNPYALLLSTGCSFISSYVQSRLI